MDKKIFEIKQQATRQRLERDLTESIQEIEKKKAEFLDDVLSSECLVNSIKQEFGEERFDRFKLSNSKNRRKSSVIRENMLDIPQRTHKGNFKFDMYQSLQNDNRLRSSLSKTDLKHKVMDKMMRAGEAPTKRLKVDSNCISSSERKQLASTKRFDISQENKNDSPEESHIDISTKSERSNQTCKSANTTFNIPSKGLNLNSSEKRIQIFQKKEEAESMNSSRNSENIQLKKKIRRSKLKAYKNPSNSLDAGSSDNGENEAQNADEPENNQGSGAPGKRSVKETILDYFSENSQNKQLKSFTSIQSRKNSIKKNSSNDQVSSWPKESNTEQKQESSISGEDGEREKEESSFSVKKEPESPTDSANQTIVEDTAENRTSGRMEIEQENSQFSLCLNAILKQKEEIELLKKNIEKILQNQMNFSNLSQNRRHQNSSTNNILQGLNNNNNNDSQLMERRAQDQDHNTTNLNSSRITPFGYKWVLQRVENAPDLLRMRQSFSKEVEFLKPKKCDLNFN